MNWLHELKIENEVACRDLETGKLFFVIVERVMARSIVAGYNKRFSKTTGKVSEYDTTHKWQLVSLTYEIAKTIKEQTDG